MNRDKILDGIKFGLGIVIGIGMSALTTTFAGTLTGKMKPVEKLCVGFASAVAGAMIGDKASVYLSDKIDEAVATVDAVSGIINQAKEKEAEPSDD